MAPSPAPSANKFVPNAQLHPAKDDLDEYLKVCLCWILCSVRESSAQVGSPFSIDYHCSGCGIIHTFSTCVRINCLLACTALENGLAS
jgi:hypothetical protein